MKKVISSKITGYAVVTEDDKLAESEMESMQEEQIIPDIDNTLAPISKPLGMQQSFTVREPFNSIAYGRLEPVITINTQPTNHIFGGEEFKTRRITELFAAQDSRAEIAGWKELAMRLSSLCIKQGVPLSKVMRQWSKITGEDNIRVKTPYGKSEAKSHEIAAMGAIMRNSLHELGVLDAEGMDVPYNKQPRLVGDGVLGSILPVVRESNDCEDSLVVHEDCLNSEGETQFPPGSQMCLACSTKAVVKMDGCMTCLNCGDSKCG